MFLVEILEGMPFSSKVAFEEMPDYPPSTDAVCWDNWSLRDNGTLKYPCATRINDLDFAWQFL